MRLFVAIQLNQKVKDRIRELQDAFRRQQVGGNYTPRENLHITLAFIGDYPDPDRVLDAMAGLRFSPFTLKLNHIGCFDSLWWAGPAESIELEKLARGLRRALAEAGIPYDKKKFKAHITFLRKPAYANGRTPPQLLVKPVEMQVARISLMRSDRGKNGMLYTELGSVSAGRAENPEAM